MAERQLTPEQVAAVAALEQAMSQSLDNGTYETWVPDPNHPLHRIELLIKDRYNLLFSLACSTLLSPTVFSS